MKILNIDLPLNKHILIALTYIYGIGISRAKNICKICNISFFKKVSNLSNLDKKNIINETNKMILESDLKKNINLNIKKLIDLKCYRGIRHLKKLPVRGQRTRTNSRTIRKFKYIK